MKNLFISFFTITTIALLAACTGAEQNADLAKLNAQRDSLKAVQRDISVQIQDLDNQIKALSEESDITLVTAYTASTATFEHYFTVYGDLRSDSEALVYPESQGVIKSILVKEGAQVSSGQALMVLDASILQEQVKEVETNLAFANETFKKQESLWKQKIGSEMQFLQAKTQKESLESTLNTLKKQISKSTVVAPFSGVVDLIMPKQGEMASPAMPVIRIVNMQKPYVKADVSEDYLGKINNGTQVQVIFPNIDTLTTTIARIGNYIKPENRTFEITVDVPTEKKLSPNLFASIKINDFRADSAVAIPASLIMLDSSGDRYVWALEKKDDLQLVVKKIITTGMTYNGKTHILTGLMGDETLVNKGAQRVTEGELVSVIRN